MGRSRQRRWYEASQVRSEARVRCPRKNWSHWLSQLRGSFVQSQVAKSILANRGGEASAAAQLATGGRSRRHDRRCFGRLEKEDQRLKKHYGRWMDIRRSLELESFTLTKLTKPYVPVNLVGPQVSHPLWWVPASRGVFIFYAS